MASQDDVEYYRDRARVERERAVDSSHPQVAARHLELAAGYDILVEREAREQGLMIGARTDNVVPIRSDPSDSSRNSPEIRIFDAG